MKKKTQIELLDNWEVDFIEKLLEEKVQKQYERMRVYNHSEEERHLIEIENIRNTIMRKLSYLPKVKSPKFPKFKPI